MAGLLSRIIIHLDGIKNDCHMWIAWKRLIVEARCTNKDYKNAARYI
jgi:hypothetical protein